MNVMLWIVFGAIVGWITSIIMGDTKQQHYVAYSMLGIVGGLLGGFLMQQLANTSEGLNLYSLVTAVGFSLLIVIFFSVLYMNDKHHS